VENVIMMVNNAGDVH